MLVIRWHRLPLGDLLPVYPGTPVPSWAKFLGVTVADEQSFGLMGDILVRWHAEMLGL